MRRSLSVASPTVRRFQPRHARSLSAGSSVACTAVTVTLP